MNETLSHISDIFFEGAAAGYVIALICHAIAFASHRVSRTAAPAAAVTGGRGGTALLTRGGDDETVTVDGPDGPIRGRVVGHVDSGLYAKRRRGPLGPVFDQAAITVTILGFVAQVISLVFRGLAAHRPPWGNMYEFTMMITAAAVAGWLVVLYRSPRMRTVGMFVMAPIAVLVFIAGTVLYTQVSPLNAALHSYWLVIHVLCISLSSGVLMLAGIASAMYLLREFYERRLAAGRTTSESRLASLPALDTLDRVAYRSTIAAFPVFTFAIIAGALWAEVAWGSYWSWDPKETVALVSWVLFAGYLHARATAGWRGRWAAWISVLGLVAILFNLFFVNMVVSGLHSYAGLN